MEQTLHALAGILLKGIPTIVIVLLLHFYLKGMLFTPLAKVLKQRDDLTAGARKAAQMSLEAAERKAAEYENAIREARSDVYKDQEQARAKLIAAQEARLLEARQRMSGMIQASKAQIEQESTAARARLADDTSALADQITNAVLAGRPS